ncbi:putative Ni/Fe-hydrogenase B-type cytochrome subunit [Variovorax sp. PBL-H6]|uniref:cytochrome b/b6 domain-containing protein n=1 Tax=Variovorax sp. PBL-H6 TaxID=434009 RepID=UPI0013161CE3|nr:cytochrome b/b6 domain-containing protein [Variovorax sp. PBL-H6]VTU15963.1 putative Ni/Fe-hydrogenase B-type cytochrome subunit [Variovorax sp. PBL-H6]
MPPALESSSRSASLDEVSVTHTRVWDLPTRVFHWALAGAVTGQLATGFGGAMEWHFRVGYAVLSLLLFRVVWGFIGGRWSRFAAFAYSPRSILNYLRGRAHPDHLIGHTPLGALSVFALLAILALQVASGLIADDEIMASGPLTRFVSGATVSLATAWHTTFGKWLAIALVSLHVLAVLFYVAIKRHPLVRPMIFGDKPVPDSSPAPSRDDIASRLLALMVFVACAAFATWIASLRA